MQRLDRSQKDKVAQFQSISGTSAATAIHCLQASNWTPELALDIFFSNDFPEEPEEVSSVDEAAIARLFDKYRDKQQVANAPHTLRRCPNKVLHGPHKPSAMQDAILAEGIQQLCEDLGVDPADIVMLVLSWHLKAACMGEFSREEFLQVHP